MKKIYYNYKENNLKKFDGTYFLPQSGVNFLQIIKELKSQSNPQVLSNDIFT